MRWPVPSQAASWAVRPAPCATSELVSWLLGGFVGGILFGLVGLSATGLVGEIIVSVIGACVCIWAGRKLFK